MATYLSHAKLNENGTTTGGQAGDQLRGAHITLSDGTDSGPLEVVTEPWYNKSGNEWYVVLRHSNATFANAVGNFAAAIAANENVGYDQTTRDSLLAQLNANNFDLSRVAPCACDCSSMVRVCCIYAGTDPGDIYTGSEEGALNAIGFQSLRGSEYISVPDNLKKGDILLRSGHTAIVSSGNGDDSYTGYLIWMGWTRFESTYAYLDPRALSVNGDSGRAYGMYQFDYRYGLVTFMQRCVDYDSSYYSGFNTYIAMGAGNTNLINNAGLKNLFIRYANERTEQFQYLQDFEAVDTYLIDITGANEHTQFSAPIKQLIQDAYGYNIMNKNPAIIGTAFSIAIRFGSTPGYQAFANGANLSDTALLNQAYAWADNLARQWTPSDSRWDSNVAGSQYQQCFGDMSNGTNYYVVPYGGVQPEPEPTKKGMPVWMMLRYHI